MTEFGEFWVCKMRTAFERMDEDQDGVLREKDFNLMADRFIAAKGLTGNNAQGVKDYYINEIWGKYFKSCTGTDTSTSDDFVENLKRQGKKNILATTDEIHSRYFEAIDTNKDGVIQLAEFTAYFEILGIDPKYAKQAFDSVDADKDGNISRCEFISAGNDFFNMEDSGNAGDYFFGPPMVVKN